MIKIIYIRTNMKATHLNQRMIYLCGPNKLYFLIQRR
jgi:hypothetical protein